MPLCASEQDLPFSDIELDDEQQPLVTVDESFVVVDLNDPLATTTMAPANLEPEPQPHASLAAQPPAAPGLQHPGAEETAAVPPVVADLAAQAAMLVPYDGPAHPPAGLGQQPSPPLNLGVFSAEARHFVRGDAVVTWLHGKACEWELARQEEEQLSQQEDLGVCQANGWPTAPPEVPLMPTAAQQQHQVAMDRGMDNLLEAERPAKAVARAKVLHLEMQVPLACMHALHTLLFSPSPSPVDSHKAGVFVCLPS